MLHYSEKKIAENYISGCQTRQKLGFSVRWSAIEILLGNLWNPTSHLRHKTHIKDNNNVTTRQDKVRKKSFPVIIMAYILAW